MNTIQTSANLYAIPQPYTGQTSKHQQQGLKEKEHLFGFYGIHTFMSFRQISHMHCTHQSMKCLSFRTQNNALEIEYAMRSRMNGGGTNRKNKNKNIQSAGKICSVDCRCFDVTCIRRQYLMVNWWWKLWKASWRHALTLSLHTAHTNRIQSTINQYKRPREKNRHHIIVLCTDRYNKWTK